MEKDLTQAELSAQIEGKSLEELDEVEGGKPRILRGIIIMVIAAIVSFALYKILCATVPYDIADKYVGNEKYIQNINKGLALLLFVAIMWFSEAVHITITALMIPILAIILGIGQFVDKAGVMQFKAFSLKEALAGFSNPTIYTFFGGFALATALHVQRLDKKIAIWIISLSGSNLLVAAVGICLVTLGLSMWISNTATAAMMLPLAIGILSQIDYKQNRGTFLFILLGIAYSASIGGLGTIVGSPPNGIAAQELGLTFAQWMKIGFPVMLILWPLMLFVLYLVFRPDFSHKIEVSNEYIPWTRERVLTIIVFVLTALTWIFSKHLGKIVGFEVDDALVALGASVVIASLGLATWKDIAKNTDWGVLYLFGGGLALSSILKSSDASLILGNIVGNAIGGAPIILIVLVIAAFIIFLTEFTSNTASAALLVPVFSTIALSLNMPKEMLVIIIGLGASCAFMLPAATPPNAIVYGTGYVRQKDMIKAGIVLNLVSIAVVGLYIYALYA